MRLWQRLASGHMLAPPALLVAVSGLLCTLCVLLWSLHGYALKEDGKFRTTSNRRRIRDTGSDCRWNLSVSGEGGTLASPGYPDVYPSNAACSWLLTAEDPDDAISLKVETLMLEQVPGCQLDYLQVYLGPEARGPSLGPFCGRLDDRLLQTNASQVLLVFRSDGAYEEKGFSVEYFTRQLGACRSEMTQSSGIIRSPGFPGNYPDNTDCWTAITVAPEKRITLSFETLELEYGENCTFDYVRVFDGPTQNSSLLGQFCRGAASLRSSSNAALLHFHSDESVNRRGYRARYTAVDRDSFPLGDCLWDSERGTVSSPNFPANYPSSANCSIRLVAPEGQRIAVEIVSMQLEMAPDCAYDYLRLTEEVSPSEWRELGTFCGRLREPRNLTSASSRVRVLFRSDDFGEFSGFRLRYAFLPGAVEESAVPEAGDAFAHAPQNASVAPHASHLIQCGTRHPNAKIRWLKDGQFLAGESPLPGLQVLSNHSLWIRDMGGPLTGVYTCAVVWPEDTRLAEAHITLSNSSCNVGFRKRPADSTFYEGRFAYLECAAAGAASVRWERDGRRPERGAVLRGTLLLQRARPADAGTYACVAADPADPTCQARAEARLTVLRRARVEDVCGRPQVGKPSEDVPQTHHAKIVGGHDAQKGAHPWQVMLWEPSLRSFCGGALLNERWIATAAHCFVNHKNLRWERVVVRLGKHDREREEPGELATAVADAGSVVVHPGFSRATLDNDLALVRLRDHVAFSAAVLPVCLGDASLLAAAAGGPLRMGTVTGWGRLKERGPSPRFLQEIRLPVVEQEACRASTNYTVSRNMFCAGYAQEVLGDACHGDSGGPFLVSRNARWHLVGIVSWGEGCGLANKYGFYTRVPNYLPWIRGIIDS